MYATDLAATVSRRGGRSNAACVAGAVTFLSLSPSGTAELDRPANDFPPRAVRVGLHNGTDDEADLVHGRQIVTGWREHEAVAKSAFDAQVRHLARATWMPRRLGVCDRLRTKTGGWRGGAGGRAARPPPRRLPTIVHPVAGPRASSQAEAHLSAVLRRRGSDGSEAQGSFVSRRKTHANPGRWSIRGPTHMDHNSSKNLLR